MGVEGGGGSSGCCLSSWRLLLPGRETVVVGAGSAEVGPLVLTKEQFCSRKVILRIVFYWNCSTQRVKMKEEQQTAITINYLL